MDEFTNYNGQNETEQNVDAGTQPRQPEKKKSKVPAIVVLVIGIVLAIAGMVVVFAAENFSSTEDAAPVDVYYAEETDEYCFALIQYMTDPVAYYEAMEKSQFYMVFDKEWNPAIICVHDDELATYQPYIDWLYSESYENEPMQMEVTGYAQPIDEELAEFAIEGYNTLWGEEVLDETNYMDMFGSYFLQIGQKNNAYSVSKIGLYILAAAVVFLVIGSVMLYQRRDVVEVSGPVIQESNFMLGILGAIFGATLGGLLWAVVAAIGYYSGWLGILIIVFALNGYNLFEHKKKVFGGILSFVLSLVMIVAASYFGYAWNYYCSLNENISGYVPLWRAVKDLYPFMVANDVMETFTLDLVKGAGFMLLAYIYMALGSRRR